MPSSFRVWVLILHAQTLIPTTIEATRPSAMVLPMDSTLAIAGANLAGHAKFRRDWVCTCVSTALLAVDTITGIGRKSLLVGTVRRDLLDLRDEGLVIEYLMQFIMG